jgi:hypothetical protein
LPHAELAAEIRDVDRRALSNLIATLRRAAKLTPELEGHEATAARREYFSRKSSLSQRFAVVNRL